MKKFLFLLLFPIIAQAQSWTTVYGTIYDGLGRVYAKQPVLVVKTLKNGAPLISSIPQTVLTDANGYVSWLSPRTAPGDTVVIYVYAQVPAYSKFGGAGVPLIIPNAASAELSTLVAPVTIPNSYPILVSGGFVSGAVLSDSLDANPRVPDVSGIISDSLDGNPRIPDVSGLISDSLDANPRISDTTGTTNQPAFSLFENMLGQFTAGTSDSLLQAQSDAKLALNIGQGKADADSVKLAFDRLGDRADADSLASVKITADAALPKADTTFLHSQKFKNIEDEFGDRADADSLASVKITADGAFQRVDTNALHAQKLKNLTDSVSKANDSIRVLGPLLTTTKNDLTSHIGTADAHLPSQTGQAGKVLGTNGTVSAWQPEADPTVALRIRDSLALYNLPWMRGDTAAIGRILDGMYPRSGGGSGVDSSRLMPGFAGQTLSYPGSITMSSGGVSSPTGTVSAKTLAGDSLRSRVRVIDTTGFIFLDSLKYKIVEYNEPYSLYRVDACCGGTNAAQSHRYGSIVVEMMVWQNGASYRTYTVRTDSANGVVCTGLAAEIIAMRSAGQGLFEGGGNSTAAVSIYRPSSVYSVIGSGGPFTFMALPTGSAAYMPWRWWHNNNTTVYKMRITIGYALPITNVSLNPVFFANS